MTTWSPGLTERTADADGLDDAGALVAQHGRGRERDGAVDDRQVGVAHPGRLHLHPAPRSGPGPRTSSSSVTSTPSPV